MAKLLSVDVMLVDDVNRYEVADWCNGGRILRDGQPGLIVPTALYGDIRAIPGDIVVKFANGFMVYTEKVKM